MVAGTQEIASGLTHIRRVRLIRNLCMAPFFGVFLVGALLELARTVVPDMANAIWSNGWFKVFWFVLWAAAVIGFLASFLAEVDVGSAKCPRCGNTFHSGPSAKWGFIRNSYARKCVNCGLRIDGSNYLTPV